jgi:hypothetical protein
MKNATAHISTRGIRSRTQFPLLSQANFFSSRGLMDLLEREVVFLPQQINLETAMRELSV